MLHARVGTVNQAKYFRVIFKLTHYLLLTSGTKAEQCSSYVPTLREGLGMLKIFVEEAAALASISLFVGMIAVWAQLIPQL